MNVEHLIAQELNVRDTQIAAAVQLLDDGATVPFIARYRKEATGGLDDQQLRVLSERLQYLRELEERKTTVLKSIAEQGKLNETLAQQIAACDNKTTLEDLYLPYKPKRRTKAQMAREHGLEPLAQALLHDPHLNPEDLAPAYYNAHVPDSKSALDGARAILMEQFAEDAELVGQLRERLWREAEIVAKVIAGKESEGEKFHDYFDHHEALCRIPSHRALALLRGRNEGILQLSLRYQPEDTPLMQLSAYEEQIATHFAIADLGRAADKWLRDTVRLCWRGKLFLSLELDAFSRLKEQADHDAIHVFARNLKDLLLAAPAGQQVTLGLDPGFRTGVKVALVDETGKLLATDVLYLHQETQALSKLSALIRQYHVRLLAIGNGTASRETEALCATLLKALGNTEVRKVVVSEAGASVYSASPLAAQEFPELDVSLRGAVSIARRLQDPLAELVKIEPKAIGVGQYQHDVNQSALARSLDDVVEDCVNAVGVDVNTASVALLSRISGLNKTLAQNIVQYRNEHGAFANRKALLKVPRLGEKTFEQAAGFLRIMGGTQPLDASAVHPEAYPIVETILKQQQLNLNALMGNTQVLSTLKAQDFVNERFGLPTVRDILKELEKPARDPRGTFKTAQFHENIHEIKDLQVGMLLEGTVTNVANFGAFVDIGVHQDGLVHISELGAGFVKDPHEVVKTGDIVKVRVLEVDEKRKRIALSMRLEQSNNARKNPEKRPEKSASRAENTTMANAFAALKRK